MKKIIILFFVMTVFFFLTGCNKASDTEKVTQEIAKTETRYNETGNKIIDEYDENDKILKSTEYVYKNSKWQASGYFTEYEYDENGNQIEITSYKSKDCIVSRETFEYDENGNRISYKTSCPGLYNLYEIKDRYDDKGNLTETQYFLEGVLFRYIYREYDDNNNLIKEYCFEDGTYEEFYYNDENNVRRKNNFTDGDFVGYSDYEYNTNGFAVIESVYTDYNGKNLLDSKIYTDEDGVILKEETYSSDGILVLLCEYDPETKKMYETEYDYYTGEKTRYTEYNGMGVVIKTETFDAGAPLTVYEYDFYGNIIK